MATSDLTLEASSMASPVIPVTTPSPAVSVPSAFAPSDTDAPRVGRLTLNGIHKKFGKSAVATINDITLATEPGEFVVVVGPSGCGKSTLLNIVAGMTRPDQGTVTLDGHAIHGPGPERAMVFQEHGLFPWLTAEQNVEFGLKMAGLDRRQRRLRVAEALSRMFLTASASKLVHELSGGMKQRIAIARALVMNPAVLLMDEPFAALDAQTRTKLHHELQALWCQTHKTILFVTHSVGEAVRLADRIIVMHAHPGRIRKEIRVELPHPRPFDNPAINELAKLVRKEIGDEVNRVHETPAQDSWQSEKSADLGDFADDMGGGI